MVVLIGRHASKQKILNNLHSRSHGVARLFSPPLLNLLIPEIPNDILKTYVNQSSYWLKFFPYVLPIVHRSHSLNTNSSFRGFLVVFDLAQVVNLVWIYLKTR